MLRSAQVYTVHENADIADPSDRVELVREGFSVWAFLFNAMWLLFNRLWIPFFIYLVLLAFLFEAHERLGLSELSIGALQFALQLMLGFSAHDIQRWALARRGYRMRGVVIAESELLAAQRAHTLAA